MTEAVEFEVPGLPADWLNAWLAAIGVTVLLPQVKLSWTEDVVPHAVFWVPDDHDLPQAILDGLPTIDDIKTMAIASREPHGRFPQIVLDEDLYRARARQAREPRATTLGFDASLSASVSDLGTEQKDGRWAPTCRGQFCVGMEGDETLWKRLRKCVDAVRAAPAPQEAILSALRGVGSGEALRLKGNGLGFDPRRLPAGVESAPKGSSPWPAVDPVVETLAFCGITLFPTRGRGRAHEGATQKPWIRDGSSPGLQYPCWSQQLNCWGIDALLDLPDREHLSRTVTARFRVRRLRPPSGQKKAAFFSEPVP